jgi:recombination protein RecT
MSQLVSVQQKIANVRSLLERLKPQIALALPKHMTADRMSRVSMTCILRTPKLLECDPTSLAGAIMTCSQLGLEPDPVLGHAHLVPFRNRRRGVTEVVMMPGYKGLMKLARNSGEIATFDAHVVHKNDTFKYSYGLKPVLLHVPFQGEAAGPATHYYAVAIMKGGAGQFVVKTKAEIEAHRDRFAKNLDDDAVWRTDFDAMALKTCIRVMAKYLPASVELQRAAALDEMAEAGIPQDLSGVIDVSALSITDTNGGETGAPKSALEGLAEKLEEKSPVPPEPEPEHSESAPQGEQERDLLLGRVRARIAKAGARGKAILAARKMTELELETADTQTLQGLYEELGG